MDNVCNMRKDLELEIHFENGHYYANMIGWRDLARKVGLHAGLWTDTMQLPDDIMNEFAQVIGKMLVYANIYDDNVRSILSEIRRV